MPNPRSLDGISAHRRPHPTAPIPTAPPKKRRQRYRGIVLYTVVFAYLALVSIPLLPRLLTLPGISRTSQSLATPPPTPLAVVSDIPMATPQPIPGPNKLTLASAEVDGEIYEGDSEKTLDKGIWHRPGTSTPDKGGNTVLAAHRFMFLKGGNTFYNLDKVQTGDQFSIVWSGKRYTYQVYEIKVVTSRAVEIEDNTEQPIVTLYTCTPLWTSENRLVVRGGLVEN